MLWSSKLPNIVNNKGCCFTHIEWTLNNEASAAKAAVGTWNNACHVDSSQPVTIMIAEFQDILSILIHNGYIIIQTYSINNYTLTEFEQILN